MRQQENAARVRQLSVEPALYSSVFNYLGIIQSSDMLYKAFIMLKAVGL